MPQPFDAVAVGRGLGKTFVQISTVQFVDQPTGAVQVSQRGLGGIGVWVPVRAAAGLGGGRGILFQILCAGVGAVAQPARSSRGKILAGKDMSQDLRLPSPPGAVAHPARFPIDLKISPGTTPTFRAGNRLPAPELDQVPADLSLSGPRFSKTVHCRTFISFCAA